MNQKSFLPITTVSSNQDQILSWIMELYCPNGFQLDPTYGYGGFYRTIPGPEIKMDLHRNGVPDMIKADVVTLPLRPESVQSIIFDPPFLVGGRLSGSATEGTGQLTKRFTQYPTMKHLFSMYARAIHQFSIVLKKGGFLVVKCQDQISGRQQYFSHVKVIEYAEFYGFEGIDLFILLSKSQIRDNRWKVQNHARKAHSYFIVFRKRSRFRRG